MITTSTALWAGALAAALGLGAAAGCDAAVGDAGGEIPRVPAFTFEADLAAASLPADVGPVGVAVFWLPATGFDGDPGALVAGAAAAVTLGAPVVVNVFDAPPAAAYAPGRDWALGAVLAFADADGDGRFGAGEQILGGAPSDWIVHARAAVPGKSSPLSRDLAPGFALLPRHALACPVVGVAVARGPDACPAGAGGPCATDADCGAGGVCATSLGGRALPGGLCAKRPPCSGADLVGGPGIAGFDDLLVPRCAVDADCRVAEGYVCELVSGYIHACLPPAERVCDTVVGDPCDGDGDCGADGRCLHAAGAFAAFPGGACTVRDGVACRPAHGRRVAVGAGDEAVLRECVAAADCRAGYRCEAPTGVCAPDVGACELLGAACGADADACGLGGRCADYDADLGPLPGGMCLVAYGAQGCTFGAGVTTSSAPASVAELLPACGSDADCRAAEGYWCNLGLGACVPPPPGACEVPIGAPCERDPDCGAGRCLTETPLQPIPRFPGGYCTASNGSGCRAADGVWYPLFADRGLLARCAADADCRDGYACDPWRAACVPARRVTLELGAGFALAVPRCP
ncbi:MAG: hypothetical protein H6745_05405 [Deltaproteobacteria bacterium]|nr:hypothetical protein [Deltaproteobacteria bacterium]